MGSCWLIQGPRVSVSWQLSKWILSLHSPWVQPQPDEQTFPFLRLRSKIAAPCGRNHPFPSESQRVGVLRKLMGPQRGWFQERGRRCWQERQEVTQDSVPIAPSLPRPCYLSQLSYCYILNCPRGYCAWRKALPTSLCFVYCLISYICFFSLCWLPRPWNMDISPHSFFEWWPWDALVGEWGQWDREGMKAHTGCLIAEIIAVVFLGDLCDWLWVILSEKSESWSIYSLTLISHWLRLAPGGYSNAGLPWAEPIGCGWSKEAPR